MEQISLFALDRKLAGKVLRASKFLSPMGRVVPWEALTGAIEPHYQGRGRHRSQGDAAGADAADLLPAAVVWPE